jgi:UDP-N-acetyl-D-glucosamine dehydrogenase
MAFKKDISDLRHSPAIKVYQIMRPRVRLVNFNDPHVPFVRLDGKRVRGVKVTTREIKKYDAVVILTDHSAYDYTFIAKNARLIIDTRNAVKRRLKKVKKLGAR